MAEFNGKEVKDDRGKKIISIKEIQEVVEGDPGISMVALWYFFVKGRHDHAGVL